MNIRDLAHLQDILDEGPYAWPGGYPLYFVMADGEALSFAAALGNRAELYKTFDHEPPLADLNEWRPVAVEINWERSDLRCAHTGELIEAAYDGAEERHQED